MTSIITSKIDVTLIYPIPIWTVAQPTVPTISEEIIAAGRPVPLAYQHIYARNGDTAVSAAHIIA